MQQGKGRIIAAVTPAEAVEVRTFRFPQDEAVPNNPALPVLLMRGALGSGAAPRAVTALLEANGWGGTWVWQVFDYHHFHPDAHEALAVATGRALLMLGGPQGAAVRVGAGDVIVLPAGTGHCQIEASRDFRICGAYPRGQESFETVRAGTPPDGRMRERIAGVARPGTDPVYGAQGPLTRAWAAA